MTFLIQFDRTSCIYNVTSPTLAYARVHAYIILYTMSPSHGCAPFILQYLYKTLFYYSARRVTMPCAAFEILSSLKNDVLLCDKQYVVQLKTSSTSLSIDLPICLLFTPNYISIMFLIRQRPRKYKAKLIFIVSQNIYFHNFFVLQKVLTSFQAPEILEQHKAVECGRRPKHAVGSFSTFQLLAQPIMAKLYPSVLKKETFVLNMKLIS